MEDDDFFAFGTREFFEAFAQLKFFAGVELVVEAAEFSECGGFAKDEGAGHPVQSAAGEIPELRDEVAGRVAAFEADGDAAGEALAGGDLGGDVVKEFGAGVGVGVDEDEPIAGGGCGAAIAGAANLADGLEDDVGTSGAGDFGGAVGGVVIANDEFGLPTASGEGGEGGVDLAEGFAEEAFFVEGGNYDGNAQKFRSLRVVSLGVGLIWRLGWKDRSFFAADDGEGFDGFGGDGIDSVEALG